MFESLLVLTEFSSVIVSYVFTFVLLAYFGFMFLCLSVVYVSFTISY